MERKTPLLNQAETKANDHVRFVAEKLLNTDFSYSNSKNLFPNDEFLHQGSLEGCKQGQSFIEFLDRLQKEVRAGNLEILKTMLRIRRKIKNGLLLTQFEVDEAQSLGLRHWRGANVQGRSFSGVRYLDMRDSNADFTTFNGDLISSYFGDLEGQTIKGNNYSQTIEGSNDGQIVEGFNDGQRIKNGNIRQTINRDNSYQSIGEGGNNAFQIIKGNNEKQEIKLSNIYQTICGTNTRQSIEKDNEGQIVHELLIRNK